MKKFLVMLMSVLMVLTFLPTNGLSDPIQLELDAFYDTATDYHIGEGICEKGVKMGHQIKTGNPDVGRAIICLSEGQLKEITADHVTIVGGYLGKETTITLDCAYTYFYNGVTKVTAESVGCAAFLIIDHDGTGGAISGWGYYAVYNGESTASEDLIVDALFVK